MTWILLANDDGVDSPALPPLARALGALGEVRVVAPDRERSWVGKAITRFDPVSVQRVERDGVEMLACSGTPADGVQLGIHALFDEVPELVVSGINLAFNHGTGFILSSGTVGAAIEGWIGGLPAVALSTGVLGADYRAWREHIRTPDAAPSWRRLAEVGAELLVDIRESGLLDHADVVNVNLPWESTVDTPREVTTIARIGYDRLFQPTGDGGWIHDFGGGILEFESLDGTDVDAANDGAISITPIRMPEALDVPDDVRRRLES